MNIMDIGFVFRTNQTLVEMELRALLEWYDHTDGSFEKRIRGMEQEFEKKSDEYWREDVGEGVTRGDLASDQHTELLSIASMTDFFGVQTTYSIFERFLFQLFREIKYFQLNIPQEFVKKKSLDLPGYKEVLKSIGISITDPPIQYSELIKLRDYRVTSAHYGGWITEENENQMRPYKFKNGDFLSLPDGYFHDAVGLVQETCQQITAMVVPVFRTHLAPPKSTSPN